MVNKLAGRYECIVDASDEDRLLAIDEIHKLRMNHRDKADTFCQAETGGNTKLLAEADRLLSRLGLAGSWKHKATALYEIMVEVDKGFGGS